MNLKDAAATAGDHAGVIWILDASNDLDANLVRFGTGQGVGEHINSEVEVIVLGISESGIVTVDGEEHALLAGTVSVHTQGNSRRTVSASEDFAYLTVHRRRRPPQIGLR